MLNWKKISIAAVFCTFMLGYCIENVSAKVVFLGTEREDEEFPFQDIKTEGGDWCKNNGYTINIPCAEDERPNRICERDSTYYDKCCHLSYSHTSCPAPTERSSDICGGKYKCYCDKTKFPFDNENCPTDATRGQACSEEVYVGKTKTVVTSYATCECPSSWKTCDASKNLVGFGKSCTLNNVRKYEACVCSPEYDKQCIEYGPVDSNDFCEIGGKRYYKNCKGGTSVCLEEGYTNLPCTSVTTGKYGYGEYGMIDKICPQDANYHSCKIDPSKWCPPKGYYYVGNCPTQFMTQSEYTSEHCWYLNKEFNENMVLSEYRYCKDSCKSQLLTGGYKEIDTKNANWEVWFNDTSKDMVVRKSKTPVELYNSTISALGAVSVKSEKGLGTGFNKCTGVATDVKTNSTTGISKHFSNINLSIDLGGAKKDWPVYGDITWKNVNINVIGEPSLSGYKLYSERVYLADNVSAIVPYGKLTLESTVANTINASSSVTPSGTSQKVVGLRFYLPANSTLETKGNGKITSQLPISISGGKLDITGASGFAMNDNGIEGYGQINVFGNGASLKVQQLGYKSSGASGSRAIRVHSYATLEVSGNLYLGGGSMVVYNGGTFRSGSANMAICNNDLVCVSKTSKLYLSGVDLASKYIYQGSQGAGFKANAGSGKCSSPSITSFNMWQNMCNGLNDLKATPPISGMY